MKVSELRIENLFYKIDRTQKVHMPIEVPMVVAEIGIPFVKFYPLGTPIEQVTKYFDVELFSMTPIPLTEEWLVKFGFQIDDDLGDQIYYQIPEQKYGYGICFDHDDITFYKFNGNGGENVHTLIYDEKHFQYVHQLQNLYYALTQTELIIKQ